MTQSLSPYVYGAVADVLRADYPGLVYFSTPRFMGDNFQKNLDLVEKIKQLADNKGCTAGQFSLAWLMYQGGQWKSQLVGRGIFRASSPYGRLADLRCNAQTTLFQFRGRNRQRTCGRTGSQTRSKSRPRRTARSGICLRPCPLVATE